MMLSIGGSPAGAKGGRLAALEPPVDGEHRLPPEAPGLDGEPPRPFEPDSTDQRRSAAHPAGEEVKRTADTDTRRGSDRPQVPVEEQFLPSGTERRENNLRAGGLDLKGGGSSRASV